MGTQPINQSHKPTTITHPTHTNITSEQANNNKQHTSHITQTHTINTHYNQSTKQTNIQQTDKTITQRKQQQHTQTQPAHIKINHTLYTRSYKHTHIDRQSNNQSNKPTNNTQHNQTMTQTNTQNNPQTRHQQKSHGGTQNMGIQTYKMGIQSTNQSH